MMHGKRFVSALIGFGLLLVFSVLTSSKAYSQVSIQSLHSYKCVDVRQSSPYLGAIIQQYHCNLTGAQKFNFRDVGNGYWQIVNAANGLCLDVSGGSPAPGAKLVQWTCHQGDNQKFVRIPVAGGGELLAIKHSGLCLDVAGWSNQDWTQLIQWNCHAGKNQQWVYFSE